MNFEPTADAGRKKAKKVDFPLVFFRMDRYP